MTPSSASARSVVKFTPPPRPPSCGPLRTPAPVKEIGRKGAKIAGRSRGVERNAVERQLRLTCIVTFERDRLLGVTVVAAGLHRDARKLVQRIGKIGRELALRGVGSDRACSRSLRVDCASTVPMTLSCVESASATRDGDRVAVEHFERSRGDRLVTAFDDARAIDAVGNVGEDDLALLVGQLAGDDGPVEQDARELDRLLAALVGDDDPNRAGIVLLREPRGSRKRLKSSSKHGREKALHDSQMILRCRTLRKAGRQMRDRNGGAAAGALSIPIEPPARSTARLAIARPRPLPVISPR